MITAFNNSSSKDREAEYNSEVYAFTIKEVLKELEKKQQQESWTPVQWAPWPAWFLA